MNFSFRKTERPDLSFTAGVVAAAALFVAGINVLNPIYIVILIVLPLLCVFLKEPLIRKLHKEAMFPEGFGAFFMEGFFELFEVCLSYVTNTISYLRVGGIRPSLMPA